MSENPFVTPGAEKPDLANGPFLSPTGKSKRTTRNSGLPLGKSGRMAPSQL